MVEYRINIDVFFFTKFTKLLRPKLESWLKNYIIWHLRMLVCLKCVTKIEDPI